LLETSRSKRKGEPLGTTHYGRTGWQRQRWNAGETLFTETEAASEGETGAEVPVLCVIRPDLPAGHTGRGLETGASQPGSTRSGRRDDQPDRNAGNRRERLCRRNPGSLANQNLPAATSAPRVHPESQWEEETAGNPCGARPGGTDGNPADPGADLRSRLRGVLLWVPSQPLGASGAQGDPHSSEQRVSGRVRRGLEGLLRFDSARQADGVRADASGGPERLEADPDVAGNPSRGTGGWKGRTGEVEPLETGNTAGGE
jgi:hypothetical protein